MTFRKPKPIMDSTDDSKLYKRARKYYLEGRGISCSFCRYHKGENLDHNLQRSWKRISKRKRQFKERKANNEPV